MSKLENIKYRTALMSFKGEIDYPQLIPIRYFKKDENIYITKGNPLIELPRIEYDTSISFSIIGYEEIIPIDYEGSPDSLLTLERPGNSVEEERKRIHSNLVNQFSEGRVETGIGKLETLGDNLVLKIEN